MGLKLCWILCLLPFINGYCYSTTYYATTNSTYLNHTQYSSNEDCTFTIEPKRTTSHSQQDTNKDYFLEISWNYFDVKGRMPECSEDYIEVFLTRSEKSLGKFCSSNLKGSSLFKMYSHDGIAKIKFHSDSSSNGRGFLITFRLRSKSSESLPGKNGCSPKQANNYADVFYTADWPESYKSGKIFDCKVNITHGDKNKVIFMDADLKIPSADKCNKDLDDHVSIRGSSSRLGESQTDLKALLCATDQAASYSFFDISVHFMRKGSGTLPNRGLVAGYVTYHENDRTDDPFMMYAYFGWVAVVTCIILLIIWIRRYKRNRCRRQLQPQIVTFQPQQYINNVCINQEGVQIGSHPSTVNMLPSYEEVTVSPHQAEEPHGNMKPEQTIHLPDYKHTN